MNLGITLVAIIVSINNIKIKNNNNYFLSEGKCTLTFIIEIDKVSFYNFHIKL